MLLCTIAPHDTQAGMNWLTDRYPWERAKLLSLRRCRPGKPCKGAAKAVEEFLVSSVNASYVPPKTNDMASVKGLEDLPDWSTIFPNVMDQGSCGSCWAFASAGMAEAAYYTSSGEFVALSPKQLVDCDTSNYGCDGGWYDGAFEYIKTKGLTSLGQYPYIAQKDSCPSKLPETVAKISSYAQLESCKDDAILKVGHLSQSPGSTPVSQTSSLLADEWC